MSLLGSGGNVGLSGASVEAENGGGDRLPCRLYRWLRCGIAAADRTFLMLLALYALRLPPAPPIPLRCQLSPPTPLVGLLWPSLGALALMGGFRELARVGMGKGGSR
jgi:hypothetical protein